MGFRPATPGLIVALTATVLLAVVSFGVPLLKSIFFLKASLNVGNVSGSITLGTLGYCLQLPNGTTCTSPAIGYEFNPNALLGNNVSSLQIPTVVVKWITYALFLHVVAFILSALSAFFGLLMHVRELATCTCCSNLFSGFAASVAFVAFIFDIVLFFIVKSRISSIAGASASLGNAIWLTLAAWVLLTISGFMYMCGSCCYSHRPNKYNRNFSNAPNDAYSSRMREDALQAGAMRQKNAREIGLPEFPSEQEAIPLKKTQYLDESDEETSNRAGVGATSPGAAFAGGYARAAPGTRAVDEYFQPSEMNMSYPPTPRYNNVAAPLPPASRPISPPRQGTYNQGHGYNAPATPPPVQQQNQYPPFAQYDDPYAQSRTAAPQTVRSPPPANVPLGQAYASPLSASGYNDLPAQNNSSNQTPYAPVPTGYNTTPIPSSGQPYVVSHGIPSHPRTSTSPPPALPTGSRQPERNYSLGGTAYDVLAPVPTAGAVMTQPLHSSPPPLQNMYTSPLGAPPGIGMEGNATLSSPYDHPVYDDSPPTYEAMPSNLNNAGQWDRRGPMAL